MVNVNQAELAKRLEVLSMVTMSRTVLPILTNVKISVADGNMRMVATNLKTTVLTNLPVDNPEAKFATTVPLSLSSNMVAAYKDKNISLSPKDNYQLVITGGKSKLTLSGIDPDEFPAIPATPSTNT